MSRVNEILDFWFGPLDSPDHFPKDKSPLWFKKDPEMDKHIKTEYEGDVVVSAEGQNDSWLNTAHGKMAQIILFDQFTRNIYRGQGQAFAHDHISLKISKEGIATGEDRTLPFVYRVFFYLPLEHSENLENQFISIEKYTELVEEAPADLKETYINFLDYAEKHKAIIDRFGRYPHRNELLGRQSTEEEIEFLKQPGSSF